MGKTIGSNTPTFAGLIVVVAIGFLIATTIGFRGSISF